MTVRALLILSAVNATFLSPAGGQVIGWRGDGSGHFADAQPPEKWSEDEGLLWSVKLPGRGYSSPVVCQGKLLLTAEPATVLCLDPADGKELWHGEAGYEQALGKEKADEIAAVYQKFAEERNRWKKQYNDLRKANPDSPDIEPLKEKMKQVDLRRIAYSKEFPEEKRGGAGNAAATVICDGETVYATFSTGIVAAVALDGQPRWMRHVEPPQIGFGHSASPLLAGGRLIVHFHDLVALDPATGREAWRAEAPAMHGTAAVAAVGGQDVLVTPSGQLRRADSGQLLAEKLFKLSNNSPLVHDGVIYAHASGKVTALALPASSDSPVEVRQLWQVSSTKDQRLASAVFHDGLLYAGGRKGILDVIEARTGEEVYRQRLDIGELFGSFTVAGSRVFVPGRDGVTLVLRPGRKYQPLASNKLQRSSSTPFFVKDRIYLRAGDQLYCIGR